MGPGILQLLLFVFFTQGLFSALDFSIRVSVKSFHEGILSSIRDVNKNMQIT